MLTVLALSLLACSTSVDLEAARCDLELSEPSPAQAAPGESVSLTATPLTSSWDTAVYVGDQRAQGVEVRREGCTDCDTCREVAECSVCGDCDECDQICVEQCVETIVFQAPALSDGAAEIRVYNAYGSGGPVILEITAGTDTGGTDTGGTDTGGTDTGGTDTGGTDTGGTDTGTSKVK